MKLYTLIFILIGIVGCQRSNKQEKNASTPQVVEQQQFELTDSLFQTEVGWGYDIKLNGKPFIHQPHMPSIVGNRGFDSKEKAQKVVGFVIYKIQNNIMPPSVSEMELDSLGAL